MLVIKIEMWPGGDERKAYNHGALVIANIGGDKTRGDYRVQAMKSERLAKRPGVWRSAIVRSFPRARLGVYDLMLRALVELVAARNPDAIRALAEAAFNDAPVEGL